MSIPRLTSAAFMALALALPAVRARADEPPPPAIPRERIVLNNLLVFRYNPLGLEDQLRAGYQLRLYDSPSPVTRDNFLFLGLHPKLNPAFAKIGPAVELQPVSIFNLKLGVELVTFFSTFGFMQSFPSPHAAYSDTDLATGKDAGANYATSGLHVMIEPTLQVKLGPIAIRNKLQLEYWSMAVRTGDTVWYDPTLDTLVPANGLVLANDLDVLYVSPIGLTVGLRWSMVRPLYQTSDYQPGDDTERNDNGHHRLGAIIAYTFHDRGYTRWNKPTLLLITSFYLDHRWRTGADRSRALPYLVLGFAFQSDLLAD